MRCAARARISRRVLAQLDAEHRFPWDFYNALAQAGWIGIAIPEEYGGSGRGITEASIVLEEIAASGAAMNGASAVHLSIFGMNPVVQSRQRRNEAGVSAAGRAGRSARRLRRDGARRRHGHDVDQDGARREGDHYVVRGRKVWTTKALDCEKRAAARQHDAARAVRAPHRWHDAAVRRTAPAGGRRSADRQAGPQRGRVVRGRVRRPAGARDGSGRRRGQGLPLSARRAQRRAHPRRVRSDRHRSRGAASGGRVCQRARRVRPPDRSEPGASRFRSPKRAPDWTLRS